MTSKSGKRNKAKRKAARKFYDANMKAHPVQKHKKAKQKNHDTHTVEIPKRLLLNMKQRQKERKMPSRI